MFRKLLSLISDVAVYGISTLLSQLIVFLLLPLYTRYLTPADMGSVRMIVIVTALFGPLATLGMVNAIFRRFNVDKEPAVRGQILSTGLCSVTIATLLLLAVSLMFAGQLARLAVGDAGAANLVRLSLFTVAATSFGAVPLAILRADRRVKTMAAVNVSKLLLTVSCTVWLVVWMGLGVRGVLVGSLCGEAITAAALFAIVFRWFAAAPSLATWKRLSSYGLPMVPHQIQGIIMSLLPPFAIGPMLGLNEAGLYDVATKFTMPISFVTGAVQLAWVAFKFQVHAEDEDPAAFFRTAVTYYVAGIMYLWVGVALWGPEMVWLMTAQTFHPAAGLVAICGLIPVAQGIYFMMGTGIELSDNTRPFPLVSFAGLVTAVVSVYVLVPRLGAVGAAVASINSFLVLTVVIYYFSQRRFRIHYDWPALISLIGLALATVFAAHFTHELPAIPRLASVIAISLAFPFAEFAVLLRSPVERHRMLLIWNKVARKGRARQPVETVAEAPAVSQRT